MPKHRSGDHRVDYGEPADREAEQLFQHAIAPGTSGDPNDSMADFPLIRDAGEPWAKAANGQSQQVKPRAPHAKPDGGLEVFDAGLDIELPPPRGWLLGNQFCRGFLSSLVAPGAAGKTALRIAQLLSLATARNLTGQHVFMR